MRWNVSICTRPACGDDRVCAPQCGTTTATTRPPPAFEARDGDLVRAASSCALASALAGRFLPWQVRSWGGLNLEVMNRLKDTSSLLFTKQIGCQFNAMQYRVMAPRVTVVEVDFSKDLNDALPHQKRVIVQATFTGTIHAAIYSWEVYSDANKTHKMTTHPEDTVHNFPRDMQWGQSVPTARVAASASPRRGSLAGLRRRGTDSQARIADAVCCVRSIAGQGIQLVEDHVQSRAQGGRTSVPMKVTKGEWLDVLVMFAEDGVLMQCLIERVSNPMSDLHGNSSAMEAGQGDDADAAADADADAADAADAAPDE